MMTFQTRKITEQNDDGALQLNNYVDHNDSEIHIEQDLSNKTPGRRQSSKKYLFHGQKSIKNCNELF